MGVDGCVCVGGGVCVCGWMAICLCDGVGVVLQQLLLIEQTTRDGETDRWPVCPVLSLAVCALIGAYVFLLLFLRYGGQQDAEPAAPLAELLLLLLALGLLDEGCTARC